MQDSENHPLSLQPDETGEEIQLDDAPPPYESLVFEKSQIKAPTEPVIFRDQPEPPIKNDDAPHSQPQNPLFSPSAFNIAVVDPVRQGEGVGAFISYKVISTVDGRVEGYRQGQHEVIRRFRDFTWLKNRLRSQYRGAILPALPEKSVVEKYKMSGEFIEQRRAALSIFLNRVALHPILQRSEDLRLFLQADENEFAIEASRLSAESGQAAPAETAGAAGAARKTITSAARLLRSLSQSAAVLTQGSNSAGSPANKASPQKFPREEEETAEYLQVRTYFSDLEPLLIDVHKQAERMVRHHDAFATALSEFSAAMAALGRYQEEDFNNSHQSSRLHPLAALSERASAVAAVSRHSSQELATSFEAPMKECMRSVRAAKKTMADRSMALADRQQAKADVEVRRSRLTRLRATPGIPEERIIEAERDLQHAMAKAEAASSTFSEIVQRMDQDLVRFQKERVEEMCSVLLLLSKIEARAADEAAQLWKSLGPPVESNNN